MTLSTTTLKRMTVRGITRIERKLAECHPTE
jgi:hypothetical protein